MKPFPVYEYTEDQIHHCPDGVSYSLTTETRYAELHNLYEQQPDYEEMEEVV